MDIEAIIVDSAPDANLEINAGKHKNITD